MKESRKRSAEVMAIKWWQLATRLAHRGAIRSAQIAMEIGDRWEEKSK